MNYLRSNVNIKSTILVILFGLQSCLWADVQVAPATIDLLALDTVAGSALMVQIRAEIANCKILFDNCLVAKPNANVLNVEKKEAPVLHSLIDAIVNKAETTSFDLVTIGFKDGQELSCHIDCPADKSQRLALGCEVLAKLTYFELLAILGHEIGHVKLNHIDKRKKAFVGTSIVVGIATSILVQGVELYNEGSAWNAMKGHCKYTFPGLVAVLTTASYGIMHVCRCHEYEADRFSYENFHQPDALISGLHKLTFTNSPVIKSENWFTKTMNYVRDLNSTHPSHEKRAAYLTQLIKQANKAVKP